jgi:hypothetical protein
VTYETKVGDVTPNFLPQRAVHCKPIQELGGPHSLLPEMYSAIPLAAKIKVVQRYFGVGQ